MLQRFAENPLIEPEQVTPSREDFEVVCAFNTGAVRLDDGTVLLLMRVAERPRAVPQDCAAAVVTDFTAGQARLKVLRVHKDDPDYKPIDPRWFAYRGQRYLTSLSHLRIARSRDGRHFEVDPGPAVSVEQPYEEFGLEDPRITRIEGRYWITYTAVSRHGICTALVSTSDFRSFERKGVIFAPENRDVTIFPEKVGGRYVCHHRPVPHAIGEASMWLAWSDDLVGWGGHCWVMGGRPGLWDSGRIGGGAVPIKTDRGWLAIYHGADRQLRYCLGAVLLDRHEPGRVLARSTEPILAPEADYETQGFFGNVVFSCGAVVQDELLSIYYGAADRCTAGASVRLVELLDHLEPV